MISVENQILEKKSVERKTVEHRQGSAKFTRATRWGNRISREARGLKDVFRPRLSFFLICAGALPDFALPGLRSQLYRLAGCNIGSRSSLLGRLSLIGHGDIAARLHIGENCIIAPGCMFGLDADVTIGRNVCISPGATLYTGTHALGFGSRRMSPSVSSKPVVVEDGVWIGMKSLILPGVTLGRGCVVSAGAVVTENVAPNTLVAGNPAVVLRTLPFGDR